MSSTTKTTWWWILGIMVVGTLWFQSSSYEAKKEAAKQAAKQEEVDRQNPAAAAERKAAEAAAARGEIIYPEMKAATAQVIRAQNLECPEVKALYILGDTAYGTKIKAVCGGVGDEQSNPWQTYIFYPKQGVVIACKSWELVDTGCD